MATKHSLPSLSDGVLVRVSLAAEKKMFEFENNKEYSKGVVQSVPSVLLVGNGTYAGKFLGEGQKIMFNQHASNLIEETTEHKLYKVPVDSVISVISEE